MSSVDVRYDSE